MRRVVGTGGGAALLIVAAWRAASEVCARMRSLASSGRLDVLVVERRARSIDRALRRRRLVAGAGAGIGSLEHARDANRHAPGRPGFPLAEALARELAARRSVTAARARQDDANRVPAWTVVLAIAGVAVTVLPLVRPLGDSAVWLAIAGGALVLTAWLGARRAGR